MINLDDVWNNLGYLLGGGAVAVMGAKRVWTKFVGDSITLTTTSSMNEMVELLAEQIRDLADTNTQLRIEIKELRESNKELSIQNMHLQAEVSKLTIQVAAITPKEI